MDEERLNELRVELDKLAKKAGLRESHLALEIVIEGQEQGRLDAPPPGLPPELWNPESKLRRVYAQIVALRKSMHVQKP